MKQQSSGHSRQDAGKRRAGIIDGKGQRMITFNNTKTIYDLIKNVGKEYENRVFVRYERDETIYEKGYGTYTSDTLAVAAYIEHLSETLGHPVHGALLGKCSYEYLTVLLGIPCGGGIAIPLDVQQKDDVMARNLTKADVDILFYDRDFSQQAELMMERCPFIKRLVCLQSRKNVRTVPMMHRVYRGETVKVKPSPASCAMIIFTSGTTGQGKGVMLSHANIIDNMFCTDDDQEICLNVLPIHHIFCISGDVMLVLRYGSTLCICDDLSRMLYYIQLFQPTMMRVVPMMAKMLCNRIAILTKQQFDRSPLEIRQQILGRRLSRMTSGGGYLSADLALELESVGITTGQGYGMSECSPKISAPDFERKDKAASVGRLVTGCQVRIVDNEIQVKSPSVMMGYYNDPELTKDTITADGWLRTGDLGYLDDENFLFLNGRKKNLIILSNGENVSPEMIENRFDGENLISDILAYGSGDRIAAEVYPNFEFAQANGITDIETAVRAIVGVHNQELPTYAQIQDVTIRNVPFEKTSSKKIIRERFFAARTARAEAVSTKRKPETDLQQQLFDIVAREIGNMDFGIDDNLYQAGLDSMGSTMLISDFVQELEVNVTLAELMDNPTVLDLEKLIRSKNSESTAISAPLPVYPLTAIMKYFAYIIPGNTTGNLPYALCLEKSVDMERLKAAILQVLDAHPLLKAIVKPTEQRYYAIYRDDTREISITLENILDSEVPAKMQSLIRAFRFREDDDLVHIHLFEGEAHNYMFLDVAHFAGDGMSMQILMEDLKNAYDGFPVEKESYSTFDYILDEQKTAENGTREKNIAYVSQLMDGLKLRYSILARSDCHDLHRGDYAAVRGRFENVARNNVLYYGKQHGVSENALFVAAFNYTISLFANENDVFCNSIHSGRTDSRWNRLVGSLFQTYFCRYTADANESVEDYIRRTGCQIMETMKLRLNTAKQSEMFFQFQGDILDVPSIGGETHRIQTQLDSLPFHFMVMYDINGYYYELRFWENRFDRTMLENFLAVYEQIIRAMLSEASVRDVKYQIPEGFYPQKYTTTVRKLHEAAGRDFIRYASPEDEVRIYILDDQFRKKPFGAWGELFVMNYETTDYLDVVEYPYGTGILYRTGLTARINSDGSVDFREKAGRIVMTDGLSGWSYHDLGAAEHKLMEMPGVDSAECWLAYDPAVNEFSLHAKLHVSGEQAPDAAAVSAYMEANGDKTIIPKFVDIA